MKWNIKESKIKQKKHQNVNIVQMHAQIHAMYKMWRKSVETESLSAIEKLK